jgi:hypothetical protein
VRLAGASWFRLFPSPGAYKRDRPELHLPSHRPQPPLTPELNQASAAAAPLRSGEFSLPSPVAQSPINIVHKFHHSTANTAHHPSSPIAPRGLAGDPTSPWTGRPEPPPAKLTLPPWPPTPIYAMPPPRPPRTGSTLRNRCQASGSRFFHTGGPPFPLTLFRFPSLACGPAPTTPSLRRVPLAGLAGPSARAATRARARLGRNPPGPLNQEFLFLFPFLSFSHFLIDIHVDILCTKNSPNILYVTK